MLDTTCGGVGGVVTSGSVPDTTCGRVGGVVTSGSVPDTTCGRVGGPVSVWPGAVALPGLRGPSPKRPESVGLGDPWAADDTDPALTVDVGLPPVPVPLLITVTGADSPPDDCPSEDTVAAT